MTCPLHSTQLAPCMECLARFGTVPPSMSKEAAFLHRATVFSPTLHGVLIPIKPCAPKPGLFGFATEVPPTIYLKTGLRASVRLVTILHEAAHLEGHWEHDQAHTDAMLQLACRATPDLLRGYQRMRTLDLDTLQAFLSVYYRKHTREGALAVEATGSGPEATEGSEATGGPLLRPPCPKCGDEDQHDARHDLDGTCWGCKGSSSTGPLSSGVGAT